MRAQEAISCALKRNPTGYKTSARRKMQSEFQGRRRRQQKAVSGPE